MAKYIPSLLCYILPHHKLPDRELNHLYDKAIDSARNRTFAHAAADYRLAERYRARRRIKKPRDKIGEFNSACRWRAEYLIGQYGTLALSLPEGAKEHLDEARSFAALAKAKDLEEKIQQLKT